MCLFTIVCETNEKSLIFSVIYCKWFNVDVFSLKWSKTNCGIKYSQTSHTNQHSSVVLTSYQTLDSLPGKVIHLPLPALNCSNFTAAHTVYICVLLFYTFMPYWDICPLVLYQKILAAVSN